MYRLTCQMSWEDKKSLTRTGECEIILQANIPRVKIFQVNGKALVKVTHCDIHMDRFTSPWKQQVLPIKQEHLVTH